VNAACLPVVCASDVVPCIDLGGQSLAAYRGNRGSIPDKSLGFMVDIAALGRDFLRIWFCRVRNILRMFHTSVNYGVKNTSKFNCIVYMASTGRLAKCDLEEVVACFK
jgi:hypothetical protein